MKPIPSSLALLLTTALAVSVGVVAKDAPKKRKPSREAIKELKVIHRKLSRDVENGVRLLRDFKKKYADDPATKKADQLLFEYGAGDEVQVVLKDRESFARSSRSPNPKSWRLPRSPSRISVRTTRRSLPSSRRIR